MKQNIFLFDIESTGVDPFSDRIIQIAWMILDEYLRPVGKPVSLIINPGIPIPQSATEIHHITNEMVKGAPTFKEVAPRLQEAIRNCHVSGYNSNGFDVPILANEFTRNDVQIPFNNETLFIDVFQMYRKLNSMKLCDVYERIFGEPMKNAHDAEGDILATHKIMEHIVNFNTPKVGTTPQNWSDFTGGMEDPHWFEQRDGVWYFTKGKHKGAQVVYEQSYCDWMMTQAFPLNTKATICKIFGADLWQSIAENRIVFNYNYNTSPLLF